MMNPTPQITHTSMDAKRQVALTMVEIKEIVYHLESAIAHMNQVPNTSEADDHRVDAGIHDEKKVMLQHIIDKLQS